MRYLLIPYFQIPARLEICDKTTALALRHRYGRVDVSCRGRSLVRAITFPLGVSRAIQNDTICDIYTAMKEYSEWDYCGACVMVAIVV